jgi:hypothetical protein
MVTRYEGLFLELLRCGTVTDMLQTLRAHIEQVDQAMLSTLMHDERFDEFYAEVVKGVLAAKDDKVNSSPS